MEFLDKLGQKATEAYKATADKTGKIARETKLNFKISELKADLEEEYEILGKKVYEKYVKENLFDSAELIEQYKKIKELKEKIEFLTKEKLELKDKKKCPKCSTEIDKNMKFCPECGEKQKNDDQEQNKENEALEGVVIIEERIEKQENQDEKNNQEESKENLAKTTEIEINPDAEGITEEELKNIGN